MWAQENYRPDAAAQKILADFKEFRSLPWLACEVLVAIRELSGAGRQDVPLHRVFERFWPIFEAYPSLSPEDFLGRLEDCRFVDYAVAGQDRDNVAEAPYRLLSDALVDWVQTGRCDGNVRDSGLMQTMRDVIGFSLTKTRDFNVPGAEIYVSALPQAHVSDSADVAILMPFHGSRRAVFEKCIRPACSARGLRCMRADEFYGSKHIVSEIFSLIKHARIVVSDISGLNPNVFYETGIAHAIGKKVLLISEQGTKVPFDVQHLRRIEYSTWWGGLSRLSASLEAAFAEIVSGPD